MGKKNDQPLGTTLKKDFAFLIVISLIVLILYFSKSELLTNIIRISDIALLTVGYVLANKANKGAGIVGIISGLLMISTILYYDIIDALLGLLLLIHSIKFINNYEKQS